MDSAVLMLAGGSIFDLVLPSFIHLAAPSRSDSVFWPWGPCQSADAIEVVDWCGQLEIIPEDTRRPRGQGRSKTQKRKRRRQMKARLQACKCMMGDLIMIELFWGRGKEWRN